MTYRVLVADPDSERAGDLARRLSGAGYDVRDCRSLAAAGAEPAVDLLILHSDALGGGSRAAVLRWRSGSPACEILLLSRQGAPEDGTFSETLSPDVDAEVLLRAVRRHAEASKLRADARIRYGFSALIGESRPIRSVLQVAGQVARSEAGAVMIRGESGSGKDLLARAIHFESARADRPFLTVMCTTLQDTLLESELFGYEKGAFTDAKARKRGVFETADGGTVFLNEIGDMSPHLQAKLLQVLDEQAFRRVGGSEDVRVDVRVIAATNRDLEQSVREGRFRMDLFYRLNIFPIFLPPLRDRLEDVPLFVTHFLSRNARKYGRHFEGIRPQALAKLRAYRWPGNVRELRNVLERACALGAGPQITEEDLRFWDMGAPSPPTGPILLPQEGVDLDAVEKSLVAQALERAAGNQSKAAGLLGISRFRLRGRMKRYGLHRKTSRPPARPRSV
jgi:DNA-binding NtrC family response regulator